MLRQLFGRDFVQDLYNVLVSHIPFILTSSKENESIQELQQETKDATVLFPQPNTDLLDSDIKRAEKYTKPFFKLDSDNNRPTKRKPENETTESLINKSKLLESIHPVNFFIYSQF